MSDIDMLAIKVHRFKGGTWAVFVTYPDNSSEQKRGLSDSFAAKQAVVEALWKMEQAASVVSAAGQETET